MSRISALLAMGTGWVKMGKHRHVLGVKLCFARKLSPAQPLKISIFSPCDY